MSDDAGGEATAEGADTTAGTATQPKLSFLQ